MYQYRIFIVKYSLSSKHRFDKYFQTNKSAACVPRFLCEVCAVLVDVVEEKEHSVGYVFVNIVSVILIAVDAIGLSHRNTRW